MTKKSTLFFGICLLFSVGSTFSQESRQVIPEPQARGGDHMAQDPNVASPFVTDAEDVGASNDSDDESEELLRDSPPEPPSDVATLEVTSKAAAESTNSEVNTELSLEDLEKMYQWNHQKHNVKEGPEAFLIQPVYEMAWRSPSHPPAMGINILVPEVPGFYSGRNYHLNISLRLQGSLIPVQTTVRYFTEGGNGMVSVNMTEIIRDHALNPWDIKSAYPLSSNQAAIIDEEADPGATLVECISNMVQESFTRNWTLSPILEAETP